MNKLLKSDDENATGDAQLLCELFSGEKVSYRYASEKKTREIGANIPFSIVGATQVPFAARLIARMDQGHGLLDRFLFLYPSCLRPDVQDSESAAAWLQTAPINCFTDIFHEMYQYHGQRQVCYQFTEDAQDLLDSLQSQEIQDINDAIRDGNPIPKCKQMDIIKRLSASLHIFNHVASKLLQRERPGPPAMRVTKPSVETAEKLVTFADSQKQITTEFINNPVASCTDKETRLLLRLLTFPGPTVTFRAFKQGAARIVRTTSQQEFANAAGRLTCYGKLVSVRIPRQPKPTNIFVKADPSTIDWSSSEPMACKKEDYESKYNLPPHSSIGAAIKASLIDGGHVDAQMSESN
ncbi:hypothetical protein AC249_AIPGENE9420 [Exaiptasia diaphana]|nr:hypothetical protein AC249_AIPGENE9420 [Exaiptasia diaphana]